ncbi:MAG: hypothetical protein A3G34_09945 [Candidatus Lindowbacteria bacterium RIFCSPLOWO2_12_FULL_62_27]|nr:MAG: hypothetical protein A3G34_09945 [Candidatus Lindowbacteria bacterium RIFCSPLOWO2_12_FULL_62_27]OGH61563.1 MAG: hypothetical protein A3I06_02955 [Candidatus Lindowbacteria bacterium RIFCSPLOWO2_02_FULL_62_12]
MPAARPILITTPIYYVNDVPHIGHAYTTIAADVVARHHRAFGRPVFFLTGTDEHGLKVQKAAEERGVSPKRHCDETVERFLSLWRVLNISFDAFIRTTDSDHEQFVRGALEDLWKKGEIVARDYVGCYCVPCERFWTDKDLQDGNCPDCRRPVERLSEKNYFFLMSRRQDELRAAIRSGRMSVLPESRRNEVLGFLEKPLEDLCISRPKKRLEWGIPLPFDADYVTYVWFDALLNYASALVYTPRGRPGATPPDWQTADIVHLIGKDILTTHSVYWPSMLLGLGWALPARIVAHGWWTVEGQKMSKSLGNAIDPNVITATYGVDAFRYFLLREVPFGQDGDFSAAGLLGRIHHDLADEFGNLVGRLAALVKQKENGKIALDAFRPEAARRKLLDDARAATESFQFSVALTALSALFADLNKKINDERPWESEASRRRETLATAAVELARAVFLLSAYTPDLAKSAAERLGCARDFQDAARLFSDDEVRRAAPWTVSAGKPLVEKLVIPLSPATLPEGKAVIDFADFQKIELKTARILTAERVAGSDKLIRLEVALGEEPVIKRQLVAGIGRRYAPEQLVGKSVIVVANLKPRKIFGVESNGMILAAGTETGLCLLTPDGEIDPGTPVQ